jgi:carboxyl-terminal processing protease
MRFATLAVALLLAASLFGAEKAPVTTQRDGAQLRQAAPQDKSLITTREGAETGKTKLLSPGPDDSKIARVVAAILERNHYNQQPFDDTVSASFLQRYLDALDPMHLVFLQTDVQGFDQWGKKLDDLTLKLGDTSPGDIIFNRFMQRFTQQVEYMTNLLETEKFDFSGNDRYEPNRRELPRPADLVEAKKLWRDRLRFEYLQEKLNKEKPEEIKNILSRRYTRQLRTLQEFDSDDVLQVYLDALAHVYDPHSDYMGKSTLDNFNISMKLSLFGIGALLQSEDGFCKIKELMDGPAKKSGKIKPNDKIIAVGQGSNAPVDVIDMKLNKVVELIRGPKGTEVRLTIVPVDAADPSVRKVVTLLRDEIKLEDQEAKARIIELPNGNGRAQRLGVIDLPSFYADLENRTAGRKSTTSDVAKLIKKLKEENVSGIILDLRKNGGGSLEEAINLTGLFIKEGPVVQVKDWNGDITVDKDTDSGVLYDGPLVVMTSRFSASASEILAGALQDYGRALIVGDSSTHGKGTVQTLLNLGPIMRVTNNFGALKITIRKFYRASGSSTQQKGVVPDIVLPSINNHADLGEGSLPNALPWDTVAPAKFDAVNVVPPVLTDLRKRSDARVAADPDYNYVRDEIARFKKAKEDKLVSLNEAQRLKEKSENEARAKARKEQLRARPEPPYKVYEITLKNAEQQGLPPATNIWAAVRASAHASVDTSNPKLRVNGSTNDTAKASTTDDEDSEKDESPVPGVDIGLEEGWRILQDLVGLTSKRSGLAQKP